MTVSLSDLKIVSALSILEKYHGENPYITKLNETLKNSKLSLTDNQAKYIIDNATRQPILINRVIGITKYLGDELQKKENLSFTPEKILIESILAETEKYYHITGKLKKNQNESKTYFIPKTQVIEDPYFEPINVDVDFTKYNEILGKENKKLYKHQEEGIKFLLSRNGCILADSMGLGKMEYVNNRVFTPNGRKRIGDLKIGDSVIGSNGKTSIVKGVFPQGKKELYRVTFNDGYGILVGGEHLWLLTSDLMGFDKYVTLSTNEILNKSSKNYYKGKNKLYIPIVKPIEFDNVYNLPIEPYLLGLIINKAYLTKFSGISIQIRDEDFEELITDTIAIENNLSKVKNKALINSKNNLITLNIEDDKDATKFIPRIYKYSSIKDRVALLQGLMDADGKIIKARSDRYITTEYYSTSEVLIDDIAELIHSLGGIVIKTRSTKNAFKLSIKLPDDIIPFRDKKNISEYKKNKKLKLVRYIQNIELEKTDDAVCISVDAPNKLYVTEHAIVTHNTTQAIIGALESDVKKVLVICPASVKMNWEREINTFCDDTTIIDGKQWSDAKFTIINYDILKNFHSLADGKGQLTDEQKDQINRTLVNANFDLIIADEAHFLKNADSIRTKVMLDLVIKYKIPKIWLLSGTPISGKPINFYSLLKLIKSPIADNWSHYTKRYCNARQFYRNGRKIWLLDGNSNLEELESKTKNTLLRRLKENVLDLPDKVITPNYLQLSSKSRKQYEMLWDEYLEKRLSLGKKNGNLEKNLNELILLRQFISVETIPHTIELVESALEEGRKVVIFTSFNDEQELLANYFGKIAVRHNGSMSTKEKQKSVDKFQEKDSKTSVFIGNIQSAGVGITLTEATVAVFNSYSWVVGDNLQAEDRLFRIGQKNDVNIYYQLFEDTISTRIWKTLKDKKDVIDAILGEDS